MHLHEGAIPPADWTRRQLSIAFLLFPSLKARHAEAVAARDGHRVDVIGGAELALWDAGCLLFTAGAFGIEPLHQLSVHCRQLHILSDLLLP